MGPCETPIERPTARVLVVDDARLTRTHLWYFAERDRWHRSVERFYLVRTPARDIVRDGWTDHERRLLTDVRWWAPDELARSTDTFAPRRLATLLLPILVGRLPNPPIDVGE